MPFLSRDWRSPGDQWVRTKEGWEKLKLWRVKLFERLNENILARLIRLAVSELNCREAGTWHKHQPYIHFVKGTTKERKVLTSLSDAFIHLDMTGAAKDIRRFNYVRRMLELCFDQRLISMSGTAQKHVISIMEEMTEQVLLTGINIAAVKHLLYCANNTLNDGRYFHLGSSILWQHHKEEVSKMMGKLDEYQMPVREDDGKIKFTDLPEDCIRHILHELADHSDIIHTGQTNYVNHKLCNETMLWKRLCFFHFSNQQLLTFLPQEMGDDEEYINWQYIYRRCYKRFGKRETYTDTLAICCYCDTLFWQSIGHPCIKEEEPSSLSLTPEAFMRLFHY